VDKRPGKYKNGSVIWENLMITSSGNKKIKDLAALIKKSNARKKHNAYIIEGIRMFKELKKDEILDVFASESFEAENGKILSEIYPEYETVSDRIFESVSDTKTPQGVMAVVKRKEYTLEKILEKRDTPHSLLILDSLQDPGNLGTLVRAGEGAGITGIIMNETTVDIYNPKVIRSTMGSIFRVPFIYVKDLKEVIQKLYSKNINIYASGLEGAIEYDAPDYTKDIAFIIGNEAAGISKEVLDIVKDKVKIPMLGEVESLNAAVAGSILMYEAARQKRK
jgi:hypothetical protein